MKELLKAHQKQSRPVTNEDMERVDQDGQEMYRLCYTPIGLYTGGLAVAHQQIEKEDPLTFFVTKERDLIINPKIIKHTKTIVDSIEGCLSFPDNEQVTVQRYNKCVVEFQMIGDDGKLSAKMTEDVSGERAKMFQHEIDHFECKYIYGDSVYIN